MIVIIYTLALTQVLSCVRKQKCDFYNIKLRQYRSIYLTGKETKMHPYLFIGVNFSGAQKNRLIVTVPLSTRISCCYPLVQTFVLGAKKMSQ